MASTIIEDENFEPAGETGLDERDRVTISQAVEQLPILIGDVAISRVQLSVSINSVGQILLVGRKHYRPG